MTLRAVIFLTCTAMAAVGTLIFLPDPIPQDPAYHRFADQRELIPGIPRTLDVVSNAAFLAVAGFALTVLGRTAAERVFVAGVIATALGSSWYHLEPDDARLAADRLGMVVALMAFLAFIVRDRVTDAAPLLWLGAFEAAGVASVVYWIVTNDLRPYGFAQFFPFAATVALLLTTRARREGTQLLWIAIAFYAAAKAGELLDREIYDAIRVVSGHTLKHLLGAAGTLFVVLWLRAPLRGAPAASPAGHR